MLDGRESLHFNGSKSYAEAARRRCCKACRQPGPVPPVPRPTLSSHPVMCTSLFGCVRAGAGAHAEHAGHCCDAWTTRASGRAGERGVDARVVLLCVTRVCVCAIARGSMLARAWPQVCTLPYLGVHVLAQVNKCVPLQRVDDKRERTRRGERGDGRVAGAPHAPRVCDRARQQRTAASSVREPHLRCVHFLFGK